jgi:hypothetical protein
MRIVKKKSGDHKKKVQVFIYDINNVEACLNVKK